MAKGVVDRGLALTLRLRELMRRAKRLVVTRMVVMFGSVGMGEFFV